MKIVGLFFFQEIFSRNRRKEYILNIRIKNRQGSKMFWLVGRLVGWEATGCFQCKKDENKIFKINAAQKGFKKNYIGISAASQHTYVALGRNSHSCTYTYCSQAHSQSSHLEFSRPRRSNAHPCTAHTLLAEAGDTHKLRLLGRVL